MPDEEMLRRLTAALHSRADPDVQAIVARAHEAATDEAVSVLAGVMTRFILERAADHLASAGPDPSEPPRRPAAAEEPVPAPARPRAWRDAAPAGPEQVWYVYGIQRAGSARPATGAAPGVAGAPVEEVEAEGLRAIVSRAPASELGEDALRAKLEDLGWVAAAAQAHEAVLGAALAEGAVLPLRFGTVFGDRGAVVRLLCDHAGDLHAEAERLAGCVEWGAKALVDARACQRWIERHAPAATGAGAATAAAGAPGGQGRSYLARKQAERDMRDIRRELVLGIATEIHEALAALSLAAATDPPQHRELSGHAGEMILNGAYLLDEASVPRFGEVATGLAERHGPKGVTIETTGPWPPHHFVRLPPIEARPGQ